MQFALINLFFVPLYYQTFKSRLREEDQGFETLQMFYFSGTLEKSISLFVVSVTFISVLENGTNHVGYDILPR